MPAEEKSFYDGQWHLKPPPPAAPTAAVQGMLSPYTAPPLVVDPWDLDAATISSPDLTENGWIVTKAQIPWTPMLRGGEVDVRNSPVMPYYRSTLRGGCLVMQFPIEPEAIEAMIYKPTSGYHTYRARMSTNHTTSPNCNYLFVSDRPQYSANDAHTYWTGTNSNNRFEAMLNAGAFTKLDADAYSNAALYEQIRYLHHISPSQIQSAGVLAPYGHGVMQPTMRNLGFSLEAAFAGVTLCHSVASFGLAHLYEIRRLPIWTYP